MKRVLTVLLLMALPVLLFAKGNTSKITIQGATLKAPIEITDPEFLKNVDIWGGPGTSSTDAAGHVRTGDSDPKWLIVDGSQGRLMQHPQGLARYQVSFYAKLPREERERLVYVVFYEYDPSTGKGYVYLPGKHEEWYSLNVGTIGHGVEGNWFRAWSAWDDVARPLIAQGK